METDESRSVFAPAKRSPVIHQPEGGMMPKRFNEGLIVVGVVFVAALILFLITEPQEPLSAVKAGETAGRVSRDFGSGFLKGFFRSKKAANKP